ncbi:MAG: terminase family protein [Candidatus Zixiibacteriota bacterium]|nr:MAG: terminase family protein [candidate division Zixibacteria bacterium]
MPHPGQCTWLNGSTTLENLLVTGNRWGKSFAEAIRIIHHAIFRIRELCYDGSGRYHIVTASITLDQARIIFNTVLRILNTTCRIGGLIKKYTVTPFPRLILGNGAVIDARSTQRRGEYLLGNDYDFFVYDEVAFDLEAEYVVNEVIKMRLADRKGKLDLVSTPNGRNWFYRKMCELRDRPGEAYVQSGDSRENCFISREYLDRQMRYLSDKRVAQNIMGQFVDSGGEVIPGKYINAALLRSPLSAPNAGGTDRKRYCLTGWDLARKQTATVGITVEVSGGVCTVVALKRIRKWDWNVILSEIRKQHLRFPGRLIIDATGLGDVVVSQLADLNPTAVIFSPKVKAELLTNVELFHSMEKIKYERWELPDEGGKIWSLEDELRSARWDDNNRCDALMALALALWPLHEPDNPIIQPRLGRV